MGLFYHYVLLQASSKHGLVLVHHLLQVHLGAAHQHSDQLLVLGSNTLLGQNRALLRNGSHHIISMLNRDETDSTVSFF